MSSDYLRKQAARCFALARSCFDLEVATQLRLLGEDLRAKADEMDSPQQQHQPQPQQHQHMRQPMQQQPMQQQQQKEDE